MEYKKIYPGSINRRPSQIIKRHVQTMKEICIAGCNKFKPH